MIKFDGVEIDIPGIITVLISIVSVIFAFYGWRNQVKTKLAICAERIVLNNNVYFQFEFLKKGKLKISNTGHRATTVIDVLLNIEDERVSLKQISNHQDINLMISPGETKYFEYDVEAVINYISNSEFKSNSNLKWIIVTNTNKKFKCITKYKVRDVIDVNKEIKKNANS